ncbi:SH3 domain-containing protein [Novipirellula artificiosorum]|uniref:Uncharacterized protein n=1 Tax=Novipirellula artificiosorum TaxID=2528016 RepID=A0A5C6D7E5_9BACT|nr:hypothetical protein [Novipirellula artificiosorum]TWU32852.1 hypothetical protein Poly41_52290 [Novipirellula artificiosorum]
MGLGKTARLLSVVAVIATVFSHATKPAFGNDGSMATEPYVVFIAQEHTYTRCGPADEYYRTDPLRYGQELEVYVETADGWLGVRPPENSFCWVPADAVEIASDGESAVVTEDRTVAWIGTHLGRARSFRWQVQLAQGEPLTVIGRSEREGADGPRLWYRIVPPSGEFRWVHNTQVAESAEELVARVRRSQSAPSPRDTQTEFLPAGATTARDGFDGRDPSRASVADVATNDVGHDDGSRPPRQESSRRTERNSTLSPVSFDEPPQLQDPRRGAPSRYEGPDAPIGSGVSQTWRDKVSGQGANLAANLQNSAMAAVEFMGRPRLSDIDTTDRGGPTAPSQSMTAAEENWVVGSSRDRSPALSSASVVQVSAEQPITQPIRPPASLQTNAPIANYLPQTTRYVSADAVAKVHDGVQGADAEQLSLMFSRLMAASASAAEVAPIAEATRRVATTSADPLIAGRAKLLAERVEQYQRIAERRDGHTVVQNGGSLPIPTSPVSMNPTAAAAIAQPTLGQTPSLGTLPSPSGATESGFLVQVYSSRKDSPPFAITDNRGRTVAYATPAPGVNLRMHLNSEIQIHGTQTYLRGVNTPHILVSEAIRTPPR